MSAFSALRRVAPAILVCYILLVGQTCRALPEFLDAARAAYKFKPGGTIDSKSCNLCHAGATNKNSLNVYGKDVKSLIEASADHKLTDALAHTLDNKDSDGDGWPNSAEFRADTLPGDPTSKPPGTPPSAATAGPGAGPAEFNPFTFQEFVYPTHAQHPIIVHFPIALFIFSLFLDLLGLRTGNRALNSAGYYNLIAAAVTGAAAVVTGLLAWKFAFGLAPLSGNKWLLYHLILGVLTTLLMGVLWAIRHRKPEAERHAPGRPYLALSLVVLIIIAITGHLGGVVSGIVK